MFFRKLFMRLPFYKLFLSASIAIFGIPAISIAAPWEGSKLSEDELRKTETRDEHAGKTDLIANRLADVKKYSFIFAYLDAYKSQAAEAKQNLANKQTTGNTLQGLEAISGLTAGLHSNVNNAFFALSVGTDILSWLTRDQSAEEYANIQKRDYQNFIHPSLWFVKIDQNKDEKSVDIPFEVNDAKLHETFENNQELLYSLPLNCEPAYYLTTNMFGGRLKGLGSYRPGFLHGRNYLCSHEKRDILPTVALNENIGVLSQRTSENIWVSRFIMERLDKKTGLQKLLSLPEDKKDLIAFELYKKLQPFFDKNWFAIYTAPDEKSVWKTYVSNDGAIIEFAIPPKPKS